MVQGTAHLSSQMERTASQTGANLMGNVEYANVYSSIKHVCHLKWLSTAKLEDYDKSLSKARF